MGNDEKLNQSQRYNESDVILKVLAETVTFLGSKGQRVCFALHVPSEHTSINLPKISWLRLQIF